MAKRTVSHVSLTPTATADTTNLVDSTYPFVVQGASSTQRTAISEVELSGQAGASSPTLMLLSRDTQIGTGSNTRDATQNDVPNDFATAALAAPVLTGNLFATNKPQRAVSAHLLNLSLNAFGGITRWTAAPGNEIYVVGNTQPGGEISVSAFTGGTPGLLGAHCIYETA